MAISELYRSKDQSPAKTTAASTTASENWILKTDSFVTPVQANVLMKALTSDNIYGFLIVGQVHPDDPSLTVTAFTVSRAIDDTFTKYIVITNLTNNTSTINNSVKPSQAQDSYQFTNAEVEVQVTNATAASKSTTASIKAKKGDAIENIMGRGIIVFETKAITRAVIVRNEADYDLKKAAEHVGKVNEGSVTINGSTFKSGQCKLIKWAGADAYNSEGKLYWRVTYEILITDDPSFFERSFIMRGVVDRDGRNAPFAAGYISEVDYKLNIDGTFMSLADQKDPTKFTSKSFPTLETSSWGKAVRLSATPNPNIITLDGDSSFGLIKS